jgi:hypothetical protein
MSRVITLDKGSKRQMKQIRWKLREVISAVFLSLIVLGLCAWAALLEMPRYSEALRTPQVTARH